MQSKSKIRVSELLFRQSLGIIERAEFIIISKRILPIHRRQVTNSRPTGGEQSADRYAKTSSLTVQACAKAPRFQGALCPPAPLSISTRFLKFVFNIEKVAALVHENELNLYVRAIFVFKRTLRICEWKCWIF